jgi:transcriptional regulator PpsR
MATERETSVRTERGFVRDVLGALNAKSAARVVAAGGDIAFVIDKGGVIRDLAVPGGDPTGGEVGAWLDKRWADTVVRDSRNKVEEMLRDAAAEGDARWREINHPVSGGGSVSLRCLALKADDDGRIIAIARDQSLVAELQQRLVQAQQALERDYARLREAEARYRLLFHLTQEAILVVDAGTRKIADANPEANRLLGAVDSALVGRAFASVVDAESRDDAVAVLAKAGGARGEARARLWRGGEPLELSASLLRQERHPLILVRISPVRASRGATDSSQRLLDALERIPDAFVVADADARIVAENAAFLAMTRTSGSAELRGASIEDYLGRPDLDRSLLISSLREHGIVRNFPTLLRTGLGEMEPVEVTAVHVPEAGYFGFSIRLAPREALRPRGALDAPRSIEQLSQLVGRVTLKELVRESTDMIERLCIEAALELTGDNRASAAEILGLSRQSLYSKLHRYGLAAPSGN